MKKDVIITISGLHTMSEDSDEVEVIAPGEYYSRNGKQFILYEDAAGEEFSRVTKNTIKISDKSVEIIKKGSSCTHMVFEEGKKNVSYYHTPFGDILVGFRAGKVDIEQGENDMQITIQYSMEVNYEHISDCVLTVSVSSKENADIALL